MDVSFDKKYIVSCSKDTSIRIWDRATGELIRVITAHRGPVNAVQLKDNVIVSASGDTFIKMWNIETGECIREFEGHTRGLACVQYDGKRIVSGSNDKKIKIWDVKTGECVMTCEGLYRRHCDVVNTYYTYYLKTDINSSIGHTDLVRTLKFDEDKMISASYDQSIRVWDIRYGSLHLCIYM